MGTDHNHPCNKGLVYDNNFIYCLSKKNKNYDKNVGKVHNLTWLSVTSAYIALCKHKSQ